MGKEAERVPFEDALTMSGFGMYSFLMVVLIGSILMALAFEVFSVAYLVPASACELNTNVTQQGLIAAIPLLGVILASNFWGYLADTRGRRKILILSLVLGFATGASATLSPNWITLLVLKLLSSSALAGTYSLAITLLGEVTPAAKRGSLIVLTNSMYLLSTGIMAAIAIPVMPLKFSNYVQFLDIHFNSWRLLNLLFSLPCLFGAFGVYLSYESPKYLLSIGEEEKCLYVLRRMFAINSNKSSDFYEVKALSLGEQVADKSFGVWQSVKSQTLPLFTPPLLKTTLLLSVLYVTVYFSIQPYMVWMPNMTDLFMKSVDRGETRLTICEMIRSSQNFTQVLETKDCSMDASAMIIILFINLLFSCLNLVLSIILQYCSIKTVLIIIQVINGIAAICINFSHHWILNALLAITFVMGSMNFGLTATFSVELFPTYVKAMGVCLTLMVGRGSALFGVNLLKYLLEYNCEASFYLFGAVTLFGGFLSLFLPSDNKKLRIAEKLDKIQTGSESSIRKDTVNKTR